MPPATEPKQEPERARPPPRWPGASQRGSPIIPPGTQKPMICVRLSARSRFMSRSVTNAGWRHRASSRRYLKSALGCLHVALRGLRTGFGLANPKLFGEREQARQMLTGQPANRPAPGTAIVTDKGLSGEETEDFFAGPDLALTLIRPARKDEKTPRYFPNWLRQRVEAIIWTLKEPARPRTPRRPGPRRAVGPRHTAPARPQRLPSGTTGRSAYRSSAP